MTKFYKPYQGSMQTLCKQQVLFCVCLARGCPQAGRPQCGSSRLAKYFAL